jgi:ABC-type uncharacterized transport system permease subunit
VILSTPPASNPTLWVVAPALLAVLTYLLVLGMQRSWSSRAFVLAWFVHGCALLAYQFGLGEAAVGARFGFALALSLTLWGVALVYAVEVHFQLQSEVRRILSMAGSASLLLVLLYPGDSLGHPSSPWAPLHWVLGLVSYGLFGVAVLHAILLDRAEGAMRSRRVPVVVEGGGALPLLTLEKRTFRFVDAGFVALSLAVLLGWVSGPAWRWDHKMVFSLLGWLVVAALLTGRHVLGWRGRRATRWLYVGSIFLLLSYVGSRFVMEVMLHRGVTQTAIVAGPQQ